MRSSVDNQKRQTNDQQVDRFNDGTLNMAYNCVTRHVLKGHGRKTALIAVDANGVHQRYTYAWFERQSNKFANVLKNRSIARGDRVFIFMPPCPERYVAFLGVVKLGAIAGALFAAFRESALLDRLSDSGATVVVTTQDLYEHIRAIQDKLPDLQTIIVVGDDSKAYKERTLSYAKAMNDASDEYEITHVTDDTPAYMLYTSGTTGKPKGIVHAHGDIHQAIATSSYVLDLQKDDVYWCTADLGWVTGIVYGLLGVWGIGATLVLYEGRFSPEAWYKTLETTKTTVFYTAPTAIRMLMASSVSPAVFHLNALRHLCSVGEPLNPEAISWSLEALGLPFYDTWWQTELGSICISNNPSLAIRPGSMGKSVPGVEAAVIDARGRAVPTGAEGDLALRASTVPSLMKSVWGQTAKYRSYFNGEWYISGDRAIKDADGYFWFVGRSDDLINTSGERVGPFEIESILVSHPKVTEAAVIGKPDKLRGEIIKAFVVTSDGVVANNDLEIELRQFVKNKLAGHAYPKEIGFLTQLPKTRSGKIMRRILRAKEMDVPIGDTSTLEEY